MTWSCLVTKKNGMNHKQGSLGGGGTDLGDGILCILSLNQNIHVEKWCLPAMNKMSFEVKKCVGNAFSRDLEIQMLKVSPSLPIMGVPQEILT